MHRLFDSGREVTSLVLAATRDHRILLFEQVAVDPERNRTDDEHHAEDPADRQQEHESDHYRERVDDEQHDAEGDPSAHEVEVAHRAREQLATRPPVVEVHRKVLELLVQRVAQVCLDVGTRLEHEPAPEPDHDRFEHAERQYGGDRPPDLARIPMLKRAIHKRAQHLRDEQSHQRGDEGRHHSEVDARHGRFRPRVDPHDRREGTLAFGAGGRGRRRVFCAVCRHRISLRIERHAPFERWPEKEMWEILILRSRENGAGQRTVS